MKTKKRDRLEIIYDILLQLRDHKSLGPTKLLRSTNLSSEMFKSYIEELLDKGFIEEEKFSKKKVFIITNSGNTFLDKFNDVKKFLDGFGL
jgi:predicted transcriptional regulator